jgi:DNA anti-recombination protein RmuC
VEGGMIEAGAAFASILAALRVIEKLVDKKMNNGAKPVHIDLNQSDISNNIGQMVELLAATGQTLERINDKIDDVHEKSTRVETLTDNINRVATETGANVFKIIEESRIKEAEERGAAKAFAKMGDSSNA